MRYLVFFLFITAAFAQTNLLSNPDFDTGFDGWMPITHPDSVPSGYVQEWCAGCGVGSSGGLHIALPGDPGTFLGFLAVIDTAIPGEKYRFAADIKYNAAILPTLTAVFIDEFYETISLADEFPLFGSSDWRYIEGYGVAPESTAHIVFVFGSGGQCEAWVDNCYLGIADTARREIGVSFTDEIGTIRNLSGVNRGPINPDSPFNFTTGFANLQIPIVRTHDWYGPGDRHVIFPDWLADPDDSSNYNFASTDTFITAIIDAGAEVFFRLGESWEADPVFNVPPPDNAVWAKVCKNIVRHYNDGWANGFHYDIQYWEIWNEPDIDWFWDAPYEEYYEMYIAVAETLKAYDPTLLIGGPAMASPTNNSFVNGMLSALDSADAPLDFFSWHTYTDGSAYNFILLNQRLRNRLDAHGFTETELILNEWNLAAAIRLEPEICNSPYNAAVSAGVLMLMQREDISQIMRYRIDSGVFGLWGEFGELTYSGYAYRFMKELYDRPVMLDVANSESTCCAILAGKAIDGNSMAVLLSDWSSNRHGYELTITDIPAVGNYSWWIYSLDESLHCEPFDSGVADGETLIVAQDMHSPALHLIALDGIATGIAEYEQLPREMVISAYPNPFNSAVTITLDGTGVCDTPLRIEIYDVNGRRLKPVTELVEVPGGGNENPPSTLRQAQGTAGSGGVVIWRPDETLGSGIYLVRAAAGGCERVGKLVYLK